MQSRPPRPVPGAHDARRWAGPLLLGGAVLYLLTLDALRDRFPGVPNLVWVAVLAALLSIGGARASGLVALAPSRAARHQFVARGTLLVGAAALALGVLSVRGAAETWTDGARAAGALALCAALALLPFGVTLRRRVAPVVRAREAAEAERRAWLATAYPGAAGAGAGPADAVDPRPPAAP